MWDDTFEPAERVARLNKLLSERTANGRRLVQPSARSGFLHTVGLSVAGLQKVSRFIVNGKDYETVTSYHTEGGENE